MKFGVGVCLLLIIYLNDNRHKSELCVGNFLENNSTKLTCYPDEHYMILLRSKSSDI
jgi:hypothetical protein